MSETLRARLWARPLLLLMPILVVGAVTLLPGTSLRAQNTAQPAVRFVNLTPFERFEWGTATVPFAEGQYGPNDHFEAVGVQSALEPFGARWPDGSVRFARLSAKVRLQPGQDLVIPVRRTTSPNITPFRLGPWTYAKIKQFNFDLIATTPNGPVTAPMSLQAVVSSCPARQTLKYRGRTTGGSLVYDLWITVFSGQDHARFELRVTNSRPSSPDWQQTITSVGFRMRNVAPFMRHATYHRLDQTPIDPNGDNIVVLVDELTDVYDGQALEWYGTLLFYEPSVQVSDPGLVISTLLANLTQELYGVATNWPASGAFGPFGVVPEHPPWFVQDQGRGEAAAAAARFQTIIAQPAPLWSDRRFGIAPYARATGDQYDFGVSQFGDIFRTTLPHRIEEVRWGAGEEAMRPVHFREEDGGMVRATDHPNWVVWSGRSHWDSIVSPDRLGKPYPEPWLHRNANGWTGKDNEHWSSLGLASAYLLTTSDSLLMELETEAELFLATRTLPSFSVAPTNAIGAPRGVGRTHLSMAWNYLCTGRTDIRDRLAARAVECVQPQHFGIAAGGAVKPMTVEPQSGSTTVLGDHWSPWEESIAAAGLAATAAISGSQTARDLAVITARSVTQHGFNNDHNDLRVGYITGYEPGGAAMTPAQLADPTRVQWAGSIAFRLWAMPAVRIALHDATVRGDQAMIQQAQSLLDTMILERAPQYTGRWDRFGNWESVF